MKKSLFLLILAASSLTLAGCGKNTASSASSSETASEGTSTEASSSQSTSTSTSTSSSTSTSTDTTPVDPEAQYRISRERFVALFLTGLHNSHVDIEESTAGAVFGHYAADFADAQADIVNTTTTYAHSYYQLSSEGILSHVDADRGGSGIDYLSNATTDVTSEGYQSAYETQRSDLLASVAPFAFKAANLASASLTYSTARTAIFLGEIYDALTYDSAKHEYAYQDRTIDFMSMSWAMTNYRFSFKNQLPQALSYQLTDTSMALAFSFAFSAIGTNKALDFPVEATNLLKYYWLRYYSDDDVTLLGKEAVGAGQASTLHDTFYKPATDSTGAYLLRSWALLGDRSEVDPDFFDAITGNHDLSGIFTEAVANDYLQYDGNNHLTILSNSPADIILPDYFSDGMGGPSEPIYIVNIASPTNVKHLTLNAHLSSIESGPTYSGAPMLNGIRFSVDPKNRLYSVQDGMLLQIVNGCEVSLVSFHDDPACRSLTVPEEVTIIGQGAFANNAHLRTIDLSHSSVTMIDYLAFGIMRAIDKIIFPSTLETVNEEAFEYAGVYDLDFSVCPLLTTIGSWACVDCPFLRSVKLPASLKTIGQGVFAECQSLESINLPKGLTSLGDMAFIQCYSLKNITLPNVATILSESQIFEDCTSLSEVTIPSKVTVIGSRTFYEDAALTSVELPSALTSIGDSAFYKSGLTSFVAPASLTGIGTGAFNGCAALKTVDLHFATGLTTIMEQTFLNCTALTSANVGTTITTIGNAAFSGCSALASLALPASLVSLGTGVFVGCNKLTLTVDAANTAFAVENGFIYNAAKTNLISYVGSPVTFTAPATLGSVNPKACFGCTSLLTADFSSLTVPCTLGSQAFCNSGITAITWPSATGTGGLSLDYNAFGNCDSLTSLTLNITVALTGALVFSGCDKLVSVDLSASVLDLTKTAFTNEPALTSLTLPTGLANTDIGAGEFENDSALASLIIPANYTRIAANAFKGCSKLNAFYLKATSLPVGYVTNWNCLNGSTMGAYYLYSETQPATNPGSYWHLVNGVPTVWTAANP